MTNSPLLSLRLDTSDDPEVAATHPPLYDSFLKLSIDLTVFKWYLFTRLFNNSSGNSDTYR